MCSHLKGEPPTKTFAAMNRALNKWILTSQGQERAQADKQNVGEAGYQKKYIHRHNNKNGVRCAWHAERAKSSEAGSQKHSGQQKTRKGKKGDPLVMPA